MIVIFPLSRPSRVILVVLGILCLNGLNNYPIKIHGATGDLIEDYLSIIRSENQA